MALKMSRSLFKGEERLSQSEISLGIPFRRLGKRARLGRYESISYQVLILTFVFPLWTTSSLRSLPRGWLIRNRFGVGWIWGIVCQENLDKIYGRKLSPSQAKLLISLWSFAFREEILRTRVQEVLFDRTPSNVCPKDRWSVQELMEHTKRIEDF